MSFREKFKHFRGQVKETFRLEDKPAPSTSSLLVNQTNPVPSPSLRARSHSPLPRSGAPLISPRVEPQIKTSSCSLQVSASSNNGQAAGTSEANATTFTRAPDARRVSSSANSLTNPNDKVGNSDARTTGLQPEIRSGSSIPISISTTAPILPDDNQNTVAQLIVPPLGPEVAEPTNDPSFLSLVSLPTPVQIPILYSKPQSGTPAPGESQNTLTEATGPLPSLHGTASDANLVSHTLDAGDQNEIKPLDTTSLSQAASIAVADPIPDPHMKGEVNKIQQTCPEPDVRAVSQVDVPIIEGAHKDTGDTDQDTPQLLDSLVTLPIAVIAPDSGPNILFDDRPGMLVPLPAKTKLTLADGAWKSFNGFRRLLEGFDNGFGPLKSVMDELGGLIGVYEDAANARTDYAALRTELEELFSMLSSHFSGNVPPAMTAGINNLCAAIENELDRILTREDRWTTRRLAEAEQDLDEVMKCYQRIQGHLKRLDLNVDLSMWKIVDEQASETRLKSLAPSLSACYNSAEALQVGRRECTPNTRKQVLADLSHWRHDKSQENMYWLNGMAGTGKTTIASSLCAMLDQSHELGASFFCSRLLPECRNVKLILPTVAYQLARLSRPFYYALSIALQADPDLHAKAIPNQMQGLIIDPLRKAAPALPQHLVIVIDALDECEDGHAVGSFLEILARRAADLPLKVFVSSRPEPQIREKIGDIRYKLILHELEASIVKQDIKLYLQTELLGLSTTVSETELAGLVERAGVLFIYAATVMRYIKSVSSPSRRQKRVREILEVKSSGSPRTNSDLDALYSTVLASAFTSPELNDDERRTMKMVVDTVVCAQEPLTVSAIAGLLGLGDASLVEDALEPLWSVLRISSADQLVTTLHASFSDYMLDPTRSKQHGCQGNEHNGRLAELCFDRIDQNEDQFNICGLESSYVFDEDVPDLEKRVRVAIPQDLWYACRYWAAHLQHGGSSAKRMQRTYHFVANRLLLWMEVVNLKQKMTLGAFIFETVELWCEKENAPQETRDLVHDARRFITMFATNDVSRSTAHLYISMLASWPKSESESVAGHYLRRAKGLPVVEGSGTTRRQLGLLGTFYLDRGVKSFAFSHDHMRIVSGSGDGAIRVWDAQTGKPLLDPLKGHTGQVNSVAFSPDGMRVASGSFDKTVRVWDAETGKALLEPLEGHTDWINSVAFSPNGMRLVSGSFDMTIRVWNVQTGRSCLNPLEGHTSSVNSVAFSPDSARIVSGSWDKTIRVWDAQTGQSLLDPFEEHTNLVNVVVFSPDGMRIASGSWDKTVRVWDAQTGKPILDPFEGHTDSVESVAFSPDGMRIVSGSSDNTIRVWDAQTGGAHLDLLKGHTDTVKLAAFSPDGMRIVSGSIDSAVRVWDAHSGRPRLEPLKGHTQSVESVLFSPDGMRIMSGSYDNTIWVWDAQTGEPRLGPLEGHTKSVNVVACSPDGKRLISGSDDRTIRVWDAQTGKPLLDPFKGRTNSVAFSPDGTRIVSGSSDNTIRVWDAQLSKPLLDPLTGHTGRVQSVSFSPDGTRIVSGSYDNTIRVWDAQLGQLLFSPLTGHDNSIRSVAFSPDGMRIVSGSFDNTVRVWDAKTGKTLLDPLKGHSRPVSSVAFSPDGMFIVSASFDMTVRVWDAQTGKALLHPFVGHTAPVNSVVFSPDGTRIVSGSDDGTIRVWSLAGLIAWGTPVTQTYKRPFSPWTLDERGWVTDQAGRPLLWLPPDLRHRLVLSNMLFLISTEGSVELDFNGAKIGESWSDCYVPCPRIEAASSRPCFT